MADDSAWLERLRGWDSVACAELIKRYHRALYAYLRQMGHRDADAHDILQETFTAAWRNVHSLRNRQAVTTWLYRICANAARMHERRLRRAESFDVDTTLEMIANVRPPHKLVEASENHEIVRRVVAAQPRPQRDILVLHYFHGLSLASCAEVLDVPVGTIKSRLARSLLKLKDALVSSGITE